MTDSNFLEYARIDDDFPPFKKDEKFEFNGYEKNKNLIEAYLKSKGTNQNISPEDNAKRFKINCLLAHNGGGKSRFFEFINKIIYSNQAFQMKGKLKFSNFEIEGRSDNSGDHNYSPMDENKTNFLLDDFFKLSSNIHFSESVNRGLLIENNEYGYNKFCIDTFYFLKEEKSNKSIFFRYLDLGEDSEISLKLAFNINAMNFDQVINLDNIITVFDSIREYIDEYEINYFSALLLKIATYTHALHIDEKSNREHYDEFFHNSQYNEEQKKEDINRYHNIKDYLYKFCNDDIFKKQLDRVINDYPSYFNDHKITREGGIYKLKDKPFYSDLGKIQYPKSSKSIISLRLKESDRLDLKSIKGLTDFFNIDIEFFPSNKPEVIFFNSLSGGQKTMLVRFTNIYMKILEEYKNGAGKKNFLILVDEPDLHLHLEWQRQYIQKLIDVFSTLDENINMHFIIATHSPFIISDLAPECILKLDGGKVSQYDGKAFGANYIDIIEKGFFFEDSTNKPLMGTFALESITQISKEFKALTFIDSYINDSNFEENKTTVNKILKDSGFKEVKKFGDWSNKKTEMFKDLNSKKDTIGDKYIRDNLSLI